MSLKVILLMSEWNHCVPVSDRAPMDECTLVLERSVDGGNLPTSMIGSLFSLARYDGQDVTGVLPTQPCRISFVFLPNWTTRA
jgi:hypothetical protein